MTLNSNGNESAQANVTGKPGADDRMGDICVLDMGKHTRKRIKQLRRGKGKLMYKVEQAVEDLREDGVLSSTAQTVIVVVREEAGLSGLFD
ncbi:MAG: hypothetical protein KDJ28_05090 [Candidatus Competibacteraceae bacterium]|nr:hypothetical protein [Candidatus Competibacteraceae bacterium]